MVWLHQRCFQQVSWVFRLLPWCGECLSGKNQRNNTTPFKIQLPENRTQPLSVQTVPFKSVASMFQGKRSRTYATTSLKILCVSCPGPAVLFSTTAREGWDSPRAKKSLLLENSSPLPSSLPRQQKKTQCT